MHEHTFAIAKRLSAEQLESTNYDLVGLQKMRAERKHQGSKTKRALPS